MPSTRDRTSTRRYGCTCPTNSYASGMLVGATVTMPTCAGGGANGLAGALLHALAANSSATTEIVWRENGLTMLRATIGERNQRPTDAIEISLPAQAA